MTLGDIKVSEGFVSSKITFLTRTGASARTDFKGGKVAASYVYWFSADEPNDGEGWYLEADDETTVNQNGVVIPFGSGFMVFKDAGDEDPELIYAGQVSTTPTTKGFESTGYNICGNCSPVDITLGDITVNSGFVSSKICFLTRTGASARVDFKGSKVAAAYTYWTEEDEPNDGPGWYLEADDETTENQNDLVIAAGQGFLVFNDAGDENPTITIPSAL